MNSNNKPNQQRKRTGNKVPRVPFNPNNALRAFTPTIRCRKRFRFNCLHTCSKLDVTDTDLLYLLGVAYTTNNVSPIFGSCRFRKIEIWSVNNNAPNAVSMGIEYKGNNPNYGNNSVVHSSSSLNTMQYCYVRSKPPRESYANAWLTNSGYNLFQITCPVGSIVDVDIEFTLIDDTPSFSDPSTPAGLTVGDMYCHSLTAQTSPGVFEPVGWNMSN